VIEQGFLKKNFVGRDGFIWWIGQIANDAHQINAPGLNATGTPLGQQKGFGYRYQVRVMGYHTADDNLLPDDQLPWASLMYPVTSGSGSSAISETPGLGKGDFVYGFFLDGEDAQQPIIMGVIGYNQYTSIYKDTPKIKPFTPFNGYGVRDSIPRYAITTSPQERARASAVSATPANIRQATGVTPAAETLQQELERDDGGGETSIPLPFVCTQSQSPGKIVKDIQKMIQDIQKAQKGLKDFKYSLTHPINHKGRQVSIQEYISIKVGEAAEKVTTFVKDRIAGAQEWITRKINAAAQDFYFLLFPDQQSNAKAAMETAMDLLACFFRKIIKNLLNIVRKALLQVVDRFINVPLCAAENILAAVIGKLSGLINSLVSQIMKPLETILGAIDIVGDVLQFIESILSFLSCEEKPACPQVKSWSLWDGPDTPDATFDPESLIRKVKGFASSVTQAIDPDSFDFDLDMDFSDILSDENTCNIRALFCGPPSVSFWGGSGEGATGNAIVSATGDILGVDIVSTGFGYSGGEPFLRFEDPCGNGSGAYGTPVLGPVSLQNGVYVSDSNGDETGVIGVIMDNPGFGYLPTPDGSRGGDGRVWAEANQTTVRRADGTYDVPYDPGEVFDVFAGDLVETASTTELIEEPRTITALEPTSTVPATSDLDYSVVLYMCDAVITNPGFGYNDGDKVVIEPNYGAEIVPTFGIFGNLESVKVISGGEGFKEFPTIYIESETGVNANIVPRFCIDRINKDEFREPAPQDSVLSVVDCVGRV